LVCAADVRPLHTPKIGLLAKYSCSADYFLQERRKTMPAKTIPIFLLLFLIAACGAPATELPPPAPAATNPPTVQSEAVAPTTESDPEPETQAAEATSQPELVYRGDALVATEPALLNFESGRPQLVEFFRFT
jgi:hypothetical protein